MSNVADENSKEINTHFMFNNFLVRKSRCLWDDAEKYCRAGQDTGNHMAYAHWMLDT